MRLPYIQATLRHLHSKNFPNIFWLRMPDPYELDEHLEMPVPPHQRVMTLWRTTVLPAVQQICSTYSFTGVMVVEDTVLLRKDVNYEDIAAEILESKARAGVWGYGDKWPIKKPDGTVDGFGWSGTKGLWMTPAWCEEINLILENTHFDRYRHVDMWLVDLLKRRRSQGFCLFSLLAGYGHRVSMSTSEPGQQKFGGCFLPEVPHGRPMRQEDRDNYIYQNAPARISDVCGFRPEHCTCAMFLGSG